VRRFSYQQNDLSKDTILSCVKHFTVMVHQKQDEDYNTVDMSRIKMYNDYSRHTAAIDAGVGSENGLLQ
jgi:beta-glucosidase